MGWTWKQICADPIFQSLPNRVESDEWGNAVILPMPDAVHSGCLSEALQLLYRLLGNGTPLPVVPIWTAKGIKTVDVAWLSDERRAKYAPIDDVLAMAPEICVEVAARHNRRGEIEARQQLYFAQGAVECWICDVKGGMKFFDVNGAIGRSRICPAFPAALQVAELLS